MEILIILIFSITLLIILATLLLLTERKYRRTLNDLKKVLQLSKRVRYGDINIRIENLNNKDLETSINRLIETINDREMMIKEYQTTLSNKNISLEQIIKQEKQLQLFKEEFAATLTHDMKVPVIAELNSLEYLLSGRFGVLNEQQTEILKLMKSSNNELKNLIENMLETYKLEQKELIINKQEHKINEFITETVKEMEPIINTSGHSYNIDINETNDIKANFDEIQLKRVIKNLIQNAVLYSPNKSQIEMKTYISIDCLKFIITNPGENISNEDLEKIFKKYYSRPSKFKKAGTGLGLYLAQKIVLAHDGKIEADTSKKGFTSFILTLPL